MLVARGHRLARPGAIDVRELDGEAVVITGHRDGAAYDRAVSELLGELAAQPLLRRGGPGPALYASVAAGDAIALTTAPAAAGGEFVGAPAHTGAARALRAAVPRRDARAGPPRADPRHPAHGGARVRAGPADPPRRRVTHTRQRWATRARRLRWPRDRT